MAPVDDFLAFHVVFGKTVPDISLNAVANLGYAAGRFGEMVYPGDTITTTSTVIGLKENSNRQTGVVYVRSVGTNQLQEMVVEYVRWVMVKKRDDEGYVTNLTGDKNIMTRLLEEIQTSDAPPEDAVTDLIEVLQSCGHLCL
jgi:hypothetical protein